MDKDTVESLRKELAAAYGLLFNALPIALRAFTSRRSLIGLGDQQDFWDSLRQVQGFVSDLDFLDDSGSAAFYQRIAELQVPFSFK